MCLRLGFFKSRWLVCCDDILTHFYAFSSIQTLSNFIRNVGANSQKFVVVVVVAAPKNVLSDETTVGSLTSERRLKTAGGNNKKKYTYIYYSSPADLRCARNISMNIFTWEQRGKKLKKKSNVRSLFCFGGGPVFRWIQRGNETEDDGIMTMTMMTRKPSK